MKYNSVGLGSVSKITEGWLVLNTCCKELEACGRSLDSGQEADNMTDLVKRCLKGGLDIGRVPNGGAKDIETIKTELVLTIESGCKCDFAVLVR